MSYKIRSKIWLEINDTIFLGEGRVMLLKTLQQTNSLNKAAKKMSMSYKKAWNLIDTMNKNSKQPVAVKKIGGKDGGGTQLTPYGIELIDKFESINKNCWKHLDKQQKKYFDLSS
ncbi:MAG: LysR family transcriptional regulator [Flavobacteriaceae bacterium]|nr:LysR family transcriptional regulator [Flavobacteriaceae bacterium]